MRKIETKKNKIRTKKNTSQIVIYKTKSGETKVDVRFENETVWLTQSGLAELFETTKNNISIHIKNIFEEGELMKEATVKDFLTVQKEGGREVSREIEHYNLDLIISVGYRIKSSIATSFRQWANTVLKSYITDGYSINKSLVQKNYEKFLLAINDVKSLLPNAGTISNIEILDLVKLFADTWFSLDSYDKSILPQKGATKKSVAITSNELGAALEELKSELISQKQATELFAQVRQVGNLQNIISNVFQSFDGKDLYPSLELKAANLLYFVIKNHPFVDGNKRSGAFAFIWFLNKAGILDKNKINPQALTALTILIAESNMKDKERMVGIVLLLLQKK
jgi:prophage maintenance system killer protein